MGENLRLAYQSITDRVALVASSEAAGAPARLLLDGRRDTVWRSDSGTAHTLTLDAGVGNTEPAGYAVLVGADALVAEAATITLQHSTTGAFAGEETTVFSITPTTPDLLLPRRLDYYREFTPADIRAWRLRLTKGSPFVAQLAGFRLGVLVEVAKNPVYPVRYDAGRVHRGAALDLGWERITPAQAEALLAYRNAVTPHWPLEAPVETAAGVVWGSRAHHVIDPRGLIFRQLGQVAGEDVLLMTPDVGPVQTWRDTMQFGPWAWRVNV